MYEGIKQATGKPKKNSAPLKSKTGETITDRGKQIGRWVEHYLDLYSRENCVTQEALDGIEYLPVLEELDTEPTLEELSNAIDALSCAKAPGDDCIPPEIISREVSPEEATTRTSLSLLERRTGSTGYSQRQDHHPVQKQGR